MKDFFALALLNLLGTAIGLMALKVLLNPVAAWSADSFKTFAVLTILLGGMPALVNAGLLCLLLKRPLVSRKAQSTTAGA